MINKEKLKNALAALPQANDSPKLTKHGKLIRAAMDILSRGVFRTSAELFYQCQALIDQYQIENPEGPTGPELTTVVVAAVFKKHQEKIQTDLENVGKTAVRKYGAMCSCEAWYWTLLWINQKNDGRQTFTVGDTEIPFIFKPLEDFFRQFSQMKIVEAAETSIDVAENSAGHNPT